MTKKKKQKLKPCPFCGEHATYVDRPGLALAVECSRCEASTAPVYGALKRDDRMAVARKLWNTRIDPAEVNSSLMARRLSITRE